MPAPRKMVDEVKLQTTNVKLTWNIQYCKDLILYNFYLYSVRKHKIHKY
jgi:hypothetical protein